MFLLLIFFSFECLTKNTLFSASLSIGNPSRCLNGSPWHNLLDVHKPLNFMATLHFSLFGEPLWLYCWVFWIDLYLLFYFLKWFCLLLFQVAFRTIALRTQVRVIPEQTARKLCLATSRAQKCALAMVGFLTNQLSSQEEVTLSTKGH